MPESRVEESILKTVRQSIGPSASYEVFDNDLIFNINTAFARLCQLGVGANSPFKITGEEESWSDFVNWNGPNGEVNEDLAAAVGRMIDEVKQYVCLSTRLVFDTPASGTVTNVFKEQIVKLEWLLTEVARYGY